MSDHVQALCDKITAWLNDVSINVEEYQLRRQAVAEMNANLGFSKVKEAAQAGHGNEYLELMERWEPMEAIEAPATEDRNWTPVAEGADVYCSPRCGFKCKRRAYDRAVKEADELAARLGHGWTPRVWENTGWNYAVARGVVTIHPAREGSAIAGTWGIVGYCCFINTQPQFVSTHRHETPESAFADALGRMQTAFDELSASVGNVTQVAKELAGRGALPGYSIVEAE